MEAREAFKVLFVIFKHVEAVYYRKGGGRSAPGGTLKEVFKDGVSKRDDLFPVIFLDRRRHFSENSSFQPGRPWSTERPCVEALSGGSEVKSWALS